MTSNLIDAMPFVFLGSRLKRLSDTFLTDATKIHHAAGIAISPSQGVLLAHIGHNGEISVVALAQTLGLSQPAITKNLNSLEKLKLIVSRSSEKDNRVKIVTLSELGRSALARIRTEIWPFVEKAVCEILGNDANEFIQSIKSIEASLAQKSFENRYNEVRKNMNENATKIIAYSPQYAQDWYDINKEWIEENFVLEPIDEFVLKNPEKAILENGGVILLAQHSIHGIVGTCALMKIDDDWWELTKLGVRANMRGHKIGEQVFMETVKKANEMGIKKLFLLTNAKQKAGIGLYEKSGWIHSKEIMDKFGTEYERCDVAMRYIG